MRTVGWVGRVHTVGGFGGVHTVGGDGIVRTVVRDDKVHTIGGDGGVRIQQDRQSVHLWRDWQSTLSHHGRWSAQSWWAGGVGIEAGTVVCAQSAE